MSENNTCNTLVNITSAHSHLQYLFFSKVIGKICNTMYQVITNLFGSNFFCMTRVHFHVIRRVINNINGMFIGGAFFFGIICIMRLHTVGNLVYFVFTTYCNSNLLAHVKYRSTFWYDVMGIHINVYNPRTHTLPTHN